MLSQAAPFQEFLKACPFWICVLISGIGCSLASIRRSTLYTLNVPF